ncbi:hypothetical protein, partial [Pseudoduganella sp. RAF53_2]|uniref:hypothetical protein n=1 Tax=Pseudoduganella sp. RAF53_2 TaxID=3233060 RepID=UPI003F977BCF
MDLLWFVLFIVIGRWAWLARRDARIAGEQVKRLQRDLASLQHALERLRPRGIAAADEAIRTPVLPLPTRPFGH